MIDPKLPGDRLLGEYKSRGEAFEECPSEEAAIQVASYLDARIPDPGVIVDRSGHVITIC